MPRKTKSVDVAPDTNADMDGDGYITVQGIRFAVSRPYAEGHTLTGLEANALNNLRGENLRNNFAAKIKRQLELQQKSELEAGYAEDQLSKELSAEAIATLRAEFTTADASYEFSLRSSRGPIDPVANEALKLAKAAVRAALEQRKIAVKDLPEGRLNELAEQLMSKNPIFMEQARVRIDAAKTIASMSLSLGDESMAQAAE